MIFIVYLKQNIPATYSEETLKEAKGRGVAG
jgi:hypothetical protein